MALSSDKEVMAYFIDSEFTDDTVTHSKPGPLAAGCQGTWTTVKKLDSSHGDSVVLVQHLSAPDDKKDVLLDQPKVFRAVKRLRSRKTWPKVDNWPTISRGLLCMARANVSDSVAVVHMLGWYRDYQFTYIVMEYYPHGNLRDWLNRSPLQGERWARDVVKQALGVLAELAVVQLAHRNITLTNILIASPLPIRIKVGDFHNAKWMTEGSGLGTQIGNEPYVAPEMHGVIDHENKVSSRYDTKIDMWALGIILHEILSKTHPFHVPGQTVFSESQYHSFLRNGEQVSVSALDGKVSAKGRAFVMAMLERDPGKRPTPASALEEPWFASEIA